MESLRRYPYFALALFSILLASCGSGRGGGGGTTTPPAPDRVQTGITDTSGRASFMTAQGVEVQLDIADSTTGNGLSGVSISFAADDDQNVLIVLQDPSGHYADTYYLGTLSADGSAVAAGSVAVAALKLGLTAVGTTWALHDHAEALTRVELTLANDLYALGNATFQACVPVSEAARLLFDVESIQDATVDAIVGMIPVYGQVRFAYRVTRRLIAPGSDRTAYAEKFLDRLFEEGLIPTHSDTERIGISVRRHSFISTNYFYTLYKATTVSCSPSELRLVMAPELPVGTAEIPYHPAKLYIAGGRGPYEWTLTEGVLPSGLLLSSTTGTVHGTPQHAGTFPLTIRATDRSSPPLTLSIDLVLTIQPAGTPIIRTINPNGTAQGTALDVHVSGANFTGASAIDFGEGIVADNLLVLSATELTAHLTVDTVARIGVRDVTLTTPRGSGVARDAFVVRTGVTMPGGGSPAAWPMVGQNAQHTNRSPYVGTDQPSVKWVFSNPSMFIYPNHSSAVGPDGTVYNIRYHTLYALDPRTGVIKWSYEALNEIVQGVAIDGRGVLYFGDYDGYLQAVDANGTRLWRNLVPISYAWNNFHILTAPVIGSDGTIYIAVTAALLAVNPDGSLRWKYEAPRACELCDPPEFQDVIPAIAPDGTVYVLVRKPYGQETLGGLFALNPNGTLRWQIPAFPEGNPLGISVADDGTIYTYDGFYHYALTSTGALKWAIPVSVSGGSFLYCGLFLTFPTIGAEGTVYVELERDQQCSLAALNPIDGTIKWRFPGLTVRGAVTTIPVDSRGVVYVNSGATLFALNPDGSIRWRYDGSVPFASPQIGADGTIYVQTGLSLRDFVALGP